MAINQNAQPLAVAQALGSQAFNAEQQKVLRVIGSAPVAFIAQVASPFASLTVAADAHNALLTALKASGAMAAS